MCDGPSLQLYAPGDWEIVPDALAELRRHLSDEHGATPHGGARHGVMHALDQSQRLDWILDLVV